MSDDRGARPARPVPYHEELAPAGVRPARWFFMLHGFLGAGRNWRSIARRLVDLGSSWGGLLVDLRMHGRSVGFPPPHTIESAADDLVVLASALERTPSAVLGHSFGGKVALEYASRALEPPAQVWVFDSTPEAGPPAGGAWETLALLRRLPSRFASRDEAVAALVDRGLDQRTAMWLATNLEQGRDGVAWRPDFDALEDLIRSFFATDLWHVVEDPPADSKIHFVKAEASRILSTEASDRIRIAWEATGRVFLHSLAGGHWLNADNPDGLVSLLEAHLA